MLVANVVGLPKSRGQRFVVLRQLGQHVERLDIFCIVIENALGPCNLANRSQRQSADLSNALGDGVAHREELICLFIEQQVVIAEMRAAHVPMEVFRLYVEGEYIGEDCVHCGRDVSGRGWFEVGARFEWSVSPAKKL